ncbi:MAG: SDR family oxidoreductase [Bdellovibrionales bacterium]
MRANSEHEWKICGTTSNPEKAALVEGRNISLIVQEQERIISDIGNLLSGTTHLLISVPPKNLGCPIFRSYFREIAQLDTLEWIGYLSSTGVYGDRVGGWVDEEAEIRPNTIRGTRRARAEAQWMSLFNRYNAPLHTFRISGIYGPGRSAIDSINAGIARRIYKENHMFNRIHIDDLVQVLNASIEAPRAGAIYNVSDDEPAPSHEVISEAADLLGVEEPPLIDIEYANLAPMTQSFYSDNKKVRNDLIKQELGVTLKYPTFREGLRACLEEEIKLEA